jgi:Protein of unknown function (DUF2442)
MRYDVIDVQALPRMALQVRFADGTAGRVRFEPSHLTGVFETLKDPRVFAQARVEAGAVTRPGDLDLAPDAMYAEIKSHGEWVLR